MRMPKTNKKTPRILVLCGSARARGNTRLALNAFLGGRRAKLIDLSAREIGYYDYLHRNSGDDFASIATEMVRADLIVFATPVYWYSMSARLKTFFDRLTDLLQTHKSLGRALKGKKCFLLVTGSDVRLPSGFQTPFRLTCRYFGMTLVGVHYLCVKKELFISQTERYNTRLVGRAAVARILGQSDS